VYFWYILKKYVKNFLIVLLGLAFLFVVVDVSFNISKLPESSNLQVLYAFYVFIYSVFVIYPLALIFAFLLTLNNMIKFNELVSFYSLGFSPKKLLKPLILSSSFIFFLMSLAQSTKITYANQYAQAIKNNMSLKNKNLFLKYNENIIFIKELNPILKKAKDIEVFELKNNKLKKVIYAKEAVFKNNRWIAKNAEVYEITSEMWKKSVKNIEFLKNFKPKILSNLKSLDNISFYDAYIAIKYFKDLDLNKILSIVFFKIFTPISMILLMIILFVSAPIHIRISNVSFFMIKSVTFSILVWGSELLLYKFTKQGVLPYWVLVLPVAVLIVLNIYILRRNND
jgi:lipopolysaccharide export system permease protein